MKVLYFASLRREIDLAEEDVVPPPEVDTVGRLKDWLAGRSARHAAALSGTARLCAAVNQDYAANDHPVAPGDEVAFFPPVTGG